MPGRLAEKMGLIETESSLSLDSEHWRMLRLAIYRRLTCDQLSANVFKVSSSRPNHSPYKVDAVSLICPCDSTTYCSHLAIAVDRWHEREADLALRGDYFAARRLNFGSLYRQALKEDDRRFLRACVKAVDERLSDELVTVGAGLEPYRCPF